ncbi:MAG: UDP-N-acetylmuramoyl-L-alanine--D-glutamate ligase, partial [Burkholderiaceae bacterium]|nr:UDP-N-acetylmuramoyl-L-alanine--D-glutamate ligase [Burkholderiaceae bacterium]
MPVEADVPMPPPEADAEAPGPTVDETATAASPAGKPAKRALPETLTAAQEAKAFVAQLFADASLDASASAEPAPEPLADSAPEEEPPPVQPEPEPQVPVSLLQDRHVLVLGLGASGLAMTRWCLRQGARVTVADTREAPPQLATLQAELPQVAFRSGA